MLVNLWEIVAGLSRELYLVSAVIDKNITENDGNEWCAFEDEEDKLASIEECINTVKSMLRVLEFEKDAMQQNMDAEQEMEDFRNGLLD